jgi:hypothetical protein
VTSHGRVWSYPKDGSGGHGGKWLNPGRNKKKDIIKLVYIKIKK